MGHAGQCPASFARRHERDYLCWVAMLVKCGRLSPIVIFRQRLQKVAAIFYVEIPLPGEDLNDKTRFGAITTLKAQ